jgi:hypothetical protein
MFFSGSKRQQMGYQGCCESASPCLSPSMNLVNLTNNTFAECPTNYQEMIQQRLSANLIDPYSAMYRFSTPEKYVYDDQYGQFILVGLNAKNRYGGYKFITSCVCRTAWSVKLTNSQLAWQLAFDKRDIEI